MDAATTPLANLEELLRVAHGLDPKAVDMDNWGYIPHVATKPDIPWEGLGNETGLIPILPCGTTACLMGHAGLDAHFNKQGIKLVWRPIYDYSDDVAPDERKVVEFHGVVMKNEQSVDEDDRIEIFGIPGDDIRFVTRDRKWVDADSFLFMPNSYRDEDSDWVGGQELKDDIIHHVETVLGYLKSPDTTKGWKTRDQWMLDEGVRPDEEPDGRGLLYIDEEETIPFVIHTGPDPEEALRAHREDDAKRGA